jgi:hypothetical protein
MGDPRARIAADLSWLPLERDRDDKVSGHCSFSASIAYDIEEEFANPVLAVAAFDDSAECVLELFGEHVGEEGEFGDIAEYEPGVFAGHG